MANGKDLGKRFVHRSEKAGRDVKAGMSRAGASSAAVNWRSASADKVKRVCSLSTRSAASREAASTNSLNVLRCNFAARVR